MINGEPGVLRSILFPMLVIPSQTLIDWPGNEPVSPWRMVRPNNAIIALQYERNNY
jgi:hypothetical protein